MTARSQSPKKRPFETALALIRADAPAEARRIESIRGQAVLAYGAATVMWLYTLELAQTAGAPVWMLRGGALLLLVLGVLQQADRFVQLIATLSAVRASTGGANGTGDV